MCKICGSWARLNDPYKIRTPDGLPLVTNHHPNCPRYNDSLIDVWCAAIDGNKCYTESEQDCRETTGDECWERAAISKIKMHREILENMPEYEGF